MENNEAQMMPRRIARVIESFGSDVEVTRIGDMTRITFNMSNGDSYARGVAQMFGDRYKVTFGIAASVIMVHASLLMP